MSKAFERLLDLIMIKAQSDTRQMRKQVVDNVIAFCNLVKRYPLSRKDRESLRQYLNQASINTVSSAIEVLKAYKAPLKGKNTDGKTSLAMAEAIQHFLNAKTVSDTLIAMSNNFEGLQTDLGKAEDDVFYIEPPFSHLAEYALRYGNDYEQFLIDIENAKDKLVYIPPFEAESSSPVNEIWKRPIHLMTALRAKGKEFDSVFLLDVNDGIWPNKNAQTPEQKEAERRVFYVAFTRAREKVLIFVNKKLGSYQAAPSPYIAELGL